MESKLVLLAVLIVLMGCNIAKERPSGQETNNPKNINTTTVSTKTKKEELASGVKAERIYDVVWFDTVVVKVNDTISLSLENDFGLGKIWKQVKGDSLQVISQRSRRTKTDKGYKNFQDNKYLGMPKGQYQIVLENKRPFGKDVGESKVLYQTIIVQDEQ